MRAPALCWTSKTARWAFWNPPWWPRAKNYLAWEINGSHGSLRWDLEHPNSLFACFSNPGHDSLMGFTEIWVTEPVIPTWPLVAARAQLGWEHSQIIEKFHFLNAVANDKPLSPYQATFEDGYRVSVIIDAMGKSSLTGKRIAIKF